MSGAYPVGEGLRGGVRGSRGGCARALFHFCVVCSVAVMVCAQLCLWELWVLLYVVLWAWRSTRYVYETLRQYVQSSIFKGGPLCDY